MKTVTRLIILTSCLLLLVNMAMCCYLLWG